MKIYTAIVSHEFGNDLYLATTMAELYAELYEYVSEWWSHDLPEDLDIPKDKVEAVKLYFAEHESETLDLDTHETKETGKPILSKENRRLSKAIDALEKALEKVKDISHG